MTHYFIRRFIILHSGSFVPAGYLGNEAEEVRYVFGGLVVGREMATDSGGSGV